MLPACIICMGNRYEERGMVSCVKIYNAGTISARCNISRMRDLNTRQSRDCARMIISGKFKLPANSFASNWFHNLSQRGQHLLGSSAFRRQRPRQQRDDPLPFSLYLNLESGVSWQLGENSRELMHRVPMVTDDPLLVAAPGGPPAWFYQQARRPGIVPASLKKRDNRGSQVKPLWWCLVVCLLNRVAVTAFPLFAEKHHGKLSRGKKERSTDESQRVSRTLYDVHRLLYKKNYRDNSRKKNIDTPKKNITLQRPSKRVWALYINIYK